jgi:hypothetical protein
LVGCGASAVTSSAPVSATRSYSGTASVGDFLTIQIDSTAGTIAYVNHSNGETGTLPYTVNSDGSYSISDPTGNLVAAYEVPGDIMLIESNKSGPNFSTPALITAVETRPAAISDFAGKTFNYIQFRTAAGGFEFGFVSIDAQGNITHDGYWPMGGFFQPPSLFNGGSFAASSVAEDSSGDFFVINEADGSSDHVFGTQNGLFAVDTGNGSILGLPQTATSAFDPASSGTYHAVLYRKNNAQMGAQNVESGTVSQFQATVTVGSDGTVTVTDSQNHAQASGKLAAVADTSSLHDGTANTLTNPCNGLFTFQTTTSSSQQTVVVAFQGSAVLLASFQTALPMTPSNSYNYFYGVGLK